MTVFLDFNINTISDVLSLIIKLDEQAPLKIQSATDSNGNYIPEGIQISFDDQNINKAICSYLEYKKQLSLMPHTPTDTSTAETQISPMDKEKNKLLLNNDCIKKSAKSADFFIVFRLTNILLIYASLCGLPHLLLCHLLCHFFIKLYQFAIIYDNFFTLCFFYQCRINTGFSGFFLH
mgnify:CR=1 FL=1